MIFLLKLLEDYNLIPSDGMHIFNNKQMDCSCRFSAEFAQFSQEENSQSTGAKTLRILSSFISYDSSKTFFGKAFQIFITFYMGITTNDFGNGFNE